MGLEPAGAVHQILGALLTHPSRRSSMFNRTSRGTARAALAALGLVMLTAAARPATASAQEIMSSVSAKHMESILSSMGLDFEKKSDTSWRVDLDGKKVLLIMANDNTDAQLYIGFGDTQVNAKQMNEWNADHRFGRAYAPLRARPRTHRPDLRRGPDRPTTAR